MVIKKRVVLGKTTIDHRRNKECQVQLISEFYNVATGLGISELTIHSQVVLPGDPILLDHIDNDPDLDVTDLPTMKAAIDIDMDNTVIGVWTPAVIEKENARKAKELADRQQGG